MQPDPLAAEFSEGLPFDEAVQFFQQKVNVPTKRWNDIRKGAHARAFMIAGAMKADLLSDLRAAVDQSIATGNFRQFQKGFDGIVAKHGWSYNGSRGWRTNVIYSTNMRSAYQAGRYNQLTDPDLLKVRPYWKYVHGDSQKPRPEHLSWDGLVLSHDDIFWQTHFPANGWGCSCRVTSLSKRGLRKLGKSGPDKAPALNLVSHQDKATSEIFKVPKGIDPGFDFNIGEAAQGRPMAKKVIDEARGGKWTSVDAKGPSEFARGSVPQDKPKAALGKRARNPSEIDGLFSKAIGGETTSIRDRAGEVIRLDQAITDHIKSGRLDGRERYFPLIREVIEDPYEIWANFAKNDLTGKYGIRRNYVKFFDLGRENGKPKIVGIVAEAVKGVWTGVTVFRGKPDALKNLRKGHLVYGRED